MVVSEEGNSAGVPPQVPTSIVASKVGNLGRTQEADRRRVYSRKESSSVGDSSDSRTTGDASDDQDDPSGPEVQPLNTRRKVSISEPTSRDEKRKAERLGQELGNQTVETTQPDDAVTSYQSLEGTFKDDIRISTSRGPQSSEDTPSIDQSPNGGSQIPKMNVEPVLSLSAPPKEIITSSHASQTSNTSKKSGASLRRGKWTVEEEAYVARVIQDFNSGFLDAPAGTTLRTYLSEKLQCDPMRITKKFTGDACIGKRVFHPAVRSPSNAAAIDKAQAELDTLERRWRRRLEMQQRESAKKAAASAAAAAAGTSSYGRNVAGHAHLQQTVVTRTASWLDRAKSVLKEPASHVEGKSNTEDDATDLESQMKEVQRLIHEGPIIQKSSAGLSDILDHVGEESTGLITTTSPTPSHSAEPADKRMRTAEDAEALVGFLRSVRASAAAGEHF